MAQHIIILGGGVGGLVAANTLRKALPKEHRVTLVEREPNFTFAPSLLWLMTGDRTAAQISRPLARLGRKGIDLVHGEIARIDAARREVTVGGLTLVADHLVIALGAEYAADTIPGLTQAGHNFYSPDGAAALRDALKRFDGGRLAVMTAAPTYKCPAAPYEAAMLFEHALRKQKIRARTRIDLYAAEAGPMGVAGPVVSAAVRSMVEAKGVTYHPEHQVVEVDPVARLIRFTNGTAATYDLLAYVPPHRTPRVVRESGLTAENGWIGVDRHTMETKHERVYALGDVVSIPLTLGKPLPKAGVFAHAEALVVAANIAHAITGKGHRAAFDGRGECFLEAGGGKAGLGRGEFYAEPVPVMKLHAPARHWHAGKVLFEKSWLRRWF